MKPLRGSPAWLEKSLAAGHPPVGRVSSGFSDALIWVHTTEQSPPNHPITNLAFERWTMTTARWQGRTPGDAEVVLPGQEHLVAHRALHRALNGAQPELHVAWGKARSCLSREFWRPIYNNPMGKVAPLTLKYPKCWQVLLAFWNITMYIYIDN